MPWPSHTRATLIGAAVHAAACVSIVLLGGALAVTLILALTGDI